ncbi:MAG: cob(I)yrinic acid a,c-diamide adenosyltransferase [bacterium]|nr:cob(I)yrinic acid a,c-diamide adenosyltransferase [bacterium]
MSKLYTGKGDGGTTKFFGCDQKRVSKSSLVAEALGNLDELNSFLGIVKVHKKASSLKILNSSFSKILEEIQENIFIICAQVAGAKKNITTKKINRLEEIIARCEKELPPITTFTIAGGTEMSALLDFARTLARCAERRVVAVNDELGIISPEILKYLNRLSSILFALARLTNLKSGIKETSPSYN